MRGLVIQIYALRTIHFDEAEIEDTLSTELSIHNYEIRTFSVFLR